MRVEFHPEADIEFTEASLWYGESEFRLAVKFSDAVSESVQLIATRPKTFPKWQGISASRKFAIRRAVMDRFPYLIAFEERPDLLLVWPSLTQNADLCTG